MLANDLEKDGADVGQQDGGEQVVALGRARRQIRRPVARVHCKGIKDSNDCADPSWVIRQKICTSHPQMSRPELVVRQQRRMIHVRLGCLVDSG